jgi:enolase
LDFKNKNSDPAKFVTADQLSEMYKSFVAKFPVVSIEDGFDQDAWDSFAKFTAANPGVQVVGDDLLVTNPKRVKQGIDKKAVNCLLLKVSGAMMHER